MILAVTLRQCFRIGDAAANYKHGNACTDERTWSTPNISFVAFVFVVLSLRWNAQCQQQGRRNKNAFHHNAV
jgi:hypothetical protein